MGYVLATIIRRFWLLLAVAVLATGLLAITAGLQHTLEHTASTGSAGRADRIGEITGALLLAAKVLLGLLAAAITAAATIAARRLTRRRHKTLVRLLILPGSGEPPTASERVRLFSGWGHMLRDQHYAGSRRIWSGAPWMALECHSVPASEETQAHIMMCVVVEPQHVESADALLGSVYRGARIGYEFVREFETIDTRPDWAYRKNLLGRTTRVPYPASLADWRRSLRGNLDDIEQRLWTDRGPLTFIRWAVGRLPYTRTHVLRLFKQSGFLMRIGVADDEVAVLDGALAVMAAQTEPVTIQFALVPLPPIFERRIARSLFRFQETRVDAQRRAGEGVGLQSELSEEQIEGGLDVALQDLFTADLRVISTSRQAAAHVASALQPGRRENTLRLRTMHLRAGLYAARSTRGEPALMPSLRHSVFSAMELAQLWYLPGPKDTYTVKRGSVRRDVAPPSVLTAAEHHPAFDTDTGLMRLTTTP